jgi:hypothetical protein
MEEQEVTPTEVIPFSKDLGSLTFYDDKSVNDFLTQVERRNNAIEQITIAAIKKLMPTDFIDMGGKPFLQGVGAARLKKYFGIQVSNVERIPETGYELIKEDDAGRLRVTYRANYQLGSMVQLGVGVRDTHNKFLCKRGDEYKAVSEINLPDLDQSARTAMDRDGVSRLLGLSGMTWDYLKTLGFEQGKAPKVTYGAGTQGGNAAGGDSDAQKNQTVIWDMCREMAGGDNKIAGDILQNYTKNDEKGYKGYRDVTKLTAKGAGWLLSDQCSLRRDYAELMEKTVEQNDLPL